MEERHFLRYLLQPKSRDEGFQHEKVQNDFPYGIRSIEKDLISEALRMSRGNRKRAASILRIPRPTLYEKLKTYGLAKRDDLS